MTSIEKAFNELEEQGLFFKSANNLLHISISISDYLDIKRLVKEMHKEEITNAYEEGYNRVVKIIENATQKNILNDLKD